MMKNVLNKKALGILALALVCVLAGSVLGSFTPAVAADSIAAGSASPFTAAIAKVKGSVVGVNNYQLVNYGGNYGSGFGGFFPWSDFYGGYGNGWGNGWGNGNNNNQSREVKYGSGSGVVVAKEYVMTNYHVVEDASSLEIAINKDDNSEPELLKATVAAYDADLDVAVLHVPGLNLEPVELGDSDTLQVGDYVFNLGNPLGFTGTATAGIVSGLNREITTGTTRDRYGRATSVVNSMIQTDAAINSGNSGGGMFDIEGRLMGIPTMRYTGNRYTSNVTAENIGLCTPINDAKAVIEKALGNGATAGSAEAVQPSAADNQGSSTVDPGLSGKPRLGVTVGNLNESVLSSGLLPRGAYIMSVDAGSPAETAGLVAGDIIVEVDGTVITSTTELLEQLSGRKAGDQVKLKVFHTGVDLSKADTIPTEGEYLEKTVTLALVDPIAQ